MPYKDKADVAFPQMTWRLTLVALLLNIITVFDNSFHILLSPFGQFENYRYE